MKANASFVKPINKVNISDFCQFQMSESRGDRAARAAAIKQQQQLTAMVRRPPFCSAVRPIQQIRPNSADVLMRSPVHCTTPSVVRRPMSASNIFQERSRSPAAYLVRTTSPCFPNSPLRTENGQADSSFCCIGTMKEQVTPPAHSNDSRQNKGTTTPPLSSALNPQLTPQDPPRPVIRKPSMLIPTSDDKPPNNDSTTTTHRVRFVAQPAESLPAAHSSLNQRPGESRTTEVVPSAAHEPLAALCTQYTSHLFFDMHMASVRGFDIPAPGSNAMRIIGNKRHLVTSLRHLNETIHNLSHSITALSQQAGIAIIDPKLNESDDSNNKNNKNVDSTATDDAFAVLKNDVFFLRQGGGGGKKKQQKLQHNETATTALNTTAKLVSQKQHDHHAVSETCAGTILMSSGITKPKRNLVKVEPFKALFTRRGPHHREYIAHLDDKQSGESTTGPGKS
jgi:hypothetical protein